MVVPPSRQCLTALALLGFASVANAVGQAIVVNHCNFPAYLWSVSNTQGPVQTLSPNGGTYSEAYAINPDGGGISLKISATDDISDPIIQFEYTLVDLLYYDISKVNGSPFGQHDLTLVPSIGSCQGVYCRPNGECASGSVFYQPYDNSAVEACDPSGNLVFNLCSSRGGGGGGGSGNNGNPGAGAPGGSTAPPALAPQPTPSPTPAPVPQQGGGVLTTLITEYVTVQTTVDQIVTITAR